MVRFEPQLFLSIVVRGNTLAFAADSIGRELDGITTTLLTVSGEPHVF